MGATGECGGALDFVTAKDLVFFPAPALCATEAAYQQNCNSRGDHQRQEASARDEPVNETMHMDSGRTIEPYLLRCKSPGRVILRTFDQRDLKSSYLTIVQIPLANNNSVAVIANIELK